jgi:hypothetical protein
LFLKSSDLVRALFLAVSARSLAYFLTIDLVPLSPSASLNPKRISDVKEITGKENKAGYLLKTGLPQSTRYNKAHRGSSLGVMDGLPTPGWICFNPLYLGVLSFAFLFLDPDKEYGYRLENRINGPCSRACPIDRNDKIPGCFGCSPD